MGNFMCCISSPGSLTRVTSHMARCPEASCGGDEDASRLLVNGGKDDEAAGWGPKETATVDEVCPQKQGMGPNSRVQAGDGAPQGDRGTINGKWKDKAGFPVSFAGNVGTWGEKGGDAGTKSELLSPFLGLNVEVQVRDPQQPGELEKPLDFHQAPGTPNIPDVNSDCIGSKGPGNPKRVELDPCAQTKLPLPPRGILKRSLRAGGDVGRVSSTLRGLLGLLTSRRFSSSSSLETIGCDLTLENEKPKEHNKRVRFRLPPDVITWPVEPSEDASGRPNIEEESEEEPLEEESGPPRRPLAGNTPRILRIPVRGEDNSAKNDSASGNETSPGLGHEKETSTGEEGTPTS